MPTPTYFPGFSTFTYLPKQHGRLTKNAVKSSERIFICARLHQHQETSHSNETTSLFLCSVALSFLFFFRSFSYSRSFAPVSVSLTALYKCFSCLRNRSICLQSLWLPCLHRSFSKLPHTFQLGPPSAATDTGKQY